MGQLIKFTDKGFLREHPFLDPITAPASIDENFNAFICPGDEVVLWHKLSLPADANTAAISNISLISVKASIVAKKPQVFSEEFSLQFKSTRVFELDSFITSFNSGNATMQLWGADGYAPNIHLQQDRNWRLPSGDFRKEVKFFTQHTPSTSDWDYFFYFPIIFRWEQWLSLLGVSDDFFNLSDPQDGKNQRWVHYFVNGIWQIASRLELKILVQGEPTTIRSELNLTPSATDGGVRDYNSNTDYASTSIKTSKIGGTLTNAPAFIYGTQDTVIKASFRKNTGWEPGERNRISALIWVEPFEGPGISARTRGSSKYQITPESVFKGLNVSSADDSGLGLTNGANFVTLDNSGKGAVAFFQVSDINIINVYAIVDYTKLAITYPGVTKFTVYARLYNSFIRGGSAPHTNQSRQGEEIKQDAILINLKSGNDICAKREPLCPFTLQVYGDLADADDLKNDKSDFYAYGDASVRDIMFILGKQGPCVPQSAATGNAGGDFNIDENEDYWIGNDIITNPAATIQQLIEVFTETLFTGGIVFDNCAADNVALLTAISNNDFGRYFPFGKSNDFLNNDFMDDYGKKYSGMLLDWRKVLQNYGPGTFQMFVVKIDVFGNATVECDPRIFCLRPYHCNFTNGSVRIETINEGIRGSLFNPTAYIDYAGGWYGQMRLRGVMKYKTSAYVKEYNQYGESSFNAYKPIINEQQAKFTLSIKPIPGWMDWVLSTDVLQADDIKITDWNNRNRHPIIKMPMMNDGDFTPRDSNLANALADVEISLAYGQNNLRKRNSQ